MKSFTQYLQFNTKHHREYINITPEMEQLVVESREESDCENYRGMSVFLCRSR